MTIERQIGDASKELAKLQKLQSVDQVGHTGLVKAVDTATARDVRDIRRHFSSDYLARVTALERIAQRSPQVGYVQWFLILLFVFVDILPVTMKVTTPAGEYEEVRDTRLTEAQMEHEVERELARSGIAFRAVAEARARNASVRDELRDLTESTADFIHDYDAQQVEFARRGVPPGGDPNSPDQMERETQVAEMFNGAWRRALARFKTHLEGT
jgi:hypothetical protein